MYWGQISLGTNHALRSIAVTVESLIGTVYDQSRRDIERARTRVNDDVSIVGASSRTQVRDSASRSEALMREIAGQGPEKTLRRGFAFVRDQSGKPLTRAEQITGDLAFEIEFSDGKVNAITEKKH